MKIINKTNELKKLCEVLTKEAFFTIDTEFLREKTYFSKLCLIQVAGKNERAIIDPLSDELDLKPFLDLLANPNVLKVFHAAYQDMEIFYHLMDGALPTPIFDTQIAASVCGLGDNVGYGKLVQHYCQTTLDKNSRFTDWSRRPLSQKQLDYAIADVTYLYDIYQEIKDYLETHNRFAWIQEDLDVLQSPATYAIKPEEVWRKIKFRNGKPQTLAIMREVAAWRERKAVEKNRPRPRILRDDVIIEIATHPPTTPKDLEKMRGLSKDFAHGKYGVAILQAVETALNSPKDTWPVLKKRKTPPASAEAKMDILRLALKLKARENNLVPRMLCSDQDLVQLINGEDNTILHTGWRWEVFGKYAKALIHGDQAIAIQNNKIKFVEVK